MDTCLGDILYAFLRGILTSGGLPVCILMWGISHMGDTLHHCYVVFACLSGTPCICYVVFVCLAGALHHFYMVFACLGGNLYLPGVCIRCC